MSLGQLKTLYCIAVMAIGTLLAFFGGIIGWLAAVLILTSALPAWRMVVGVIRSDTITAFEYRARLRAHSKERPATALQDPDHPGNQPEALIESHSTHRA